MQALVFSLVLAAGPAWDHPGYDAEDSHYNPAESAITAQTVRHLGVQWSVPLRRSDESCAGWTAPLLSGGRVFVGDQLGISAYSARTGALNWRFDWEDPMDSRPPVLAVTGGVLIAANGDCNSMSDPDGRITALDMSTGTPRWVLEPDAPIRGVVADKEVVVVSGWSQSDEDAVVAYRAEDGRMLWRKPHWASTGVSAAGTILIHRTDGFGKPRKQTSAVNVGTGAALWSRAAAWSAQAADPAGSTFLVTDTGSALLAVDAATGAVDWTVAGKASELIAVDGLGVYRSAGQTVEALHARTGGRLWARQLPQKATQPIRAGDLLYAGGPVLDAVRGTVAGPARPGKVVVTDGRLYCVEQGVLTAFAPRPA